ncbi:MAG: TonB-dependent receptor [Kiritimatiellae bacterium]|nr:TonB-dependent receptor [Kiritimatiellia bacterium]
MSYSSWFAGLFAVSVWVSAQAEEALPAGGANELVVTAERISADVWSTPYTIRSLDAADLEMSAAPRSITEALRDQPSTMIQKTSHGQGSPFLRGFTGYRTLMLVDGIRLNNAVFRDGPNQYWNTVDFWALDGMETVMGPASVLYGSDAIGGAVNALPTKPSLKDRAWRSRSRVRFSSAERARMARLETSGPLDADTALHAGFSWKEFGDLRGGRDVGSQPHTGYDEWAVDAVLRRRLGDAGELTLGHQTVRQDDVWRTHRTIYGIDWEGLTRGSDLSHMFDQARDLTWARLDAEPSDALLDSVVLTVYRQAQGEDVYRVRDGGARDRQGFDVETWGANAQGSAETPSGTWTCGVDIARDYADSYSHRLNEDGSVKSSAIQGPVGDEAAYDTVGVYAQDSIPLLDQRVRLLPGVRYSYARAQADRVQDPVSGNAIRVDDDWHAVVGSMRAVWALDDEERLHIFAGASQGYRAPNLSDLTRFDIARSHELETPVTDLDPERFLSFEAGVKLRTERFQTQAAVYHTMIDGLIVRAPSGRIVDSLQEVTKKNAGDGYVQGVECSAEWTFMKDWTARGWVCWMDGEVDGYPTSSPETQREPISRLMPFAAELAVRWTPEACRWWIESAVTGADRADDLPASDRSDTQRIPPDGTPGYVVWAVRGGCRISSSLQCSLGVENLLDEDYRIHGSGVNEPGRNFVAALDAQF